MYKKIFIFLGIFFIFIFLSCKSSSNVNNNSQGIINISYEYYQIAEEYLKLNKYSKAIEYYKKIENLTEYKNTVRYKLARCYALNSQWEDSLRMYNILLEEDPNNTSLLTSVAYIYAKTLQFDKASNIYEKLIIAQEYSPSILKNYILVELANNNLDKVEKLKELFRQRFPLDDSINKLVTDTEKIIESSKKQAENKDNKKQKATKKDGEKSQEATKKDDEKSQEATSDKTKKIDIKSDAIIESDTDTIGEQENLSDKNDKIDIQKEIDSKTDNSQNKNN